MFDFLRKVDLFADLSESDLQRICDGVEELQLSDGEQLFAEGSPADHAYVIKEGQLEILKASGGREVQIAVRNPGEVIGEMGLLEQAPRMAGARARGTSVVLAVPRKQFEELTAKPAAMRTMLLTVTRRLRETEAMLRQSERMAQLGTMTAGVAHELNNPASAVRRAAEQLEPELQRFENAQSAVGTLGLQREQLEELEAELQRAEVAASEMPELDSLARSDREAELETWLEGHAIPEAWEVAPRLVDLGLDDSRLDRLAQLFDAQQLPVVIEALAASYGVHNLTKEIGQAAGRISGIVKALKTYSYLDQAPVQPVDIHEGLNDTLLILRGKLKEGIKVRRDYADELPRIQGYGSELNQVWTNLIDNALDALNGSGEMVLRTRLEGDSVVVEVVDDGPGIPAEIQSKIFDPFFTTKPPGQGTGLGLDISYSIVVNKHRGDLRLASEPGNTRFEVWLPVNFEAV
jgi:signal transduction histidine kinase